MGKTPLMNQQLKLQFFDVHYEMVDVVVGRILMLRSQTESLRLLALRVLSFLENSVKPFLLVTYEFEEMKETEFLVVLLLKTILKYALVVLLKPMRNNKSVEGS